MAEDKQTRIPGTYDEPVPAVAEAAELYAGTMRARMAMQEDEETQKTTLKEVMAEHNVDVVKLEDDIVTRVHVEERYDIKVKKKKKDSE